MRRLFWAAMMAVVMTGLWSGGSDAVEHRLTPGQDAAAAGMRSFGVTRPPFGYVEFCRRHPRDCMRYDSSAEVAELTRERWKELVDINRLINDLVEPVTDSDLYSQVEYWTYPAGRGDCEDYVLAKRRLLIQYGWPAAALRITVVRDEADQGHAVLMVVTDSGDFVLDNKRSEILTWQATPYTFQKRQSAVDPLVWESLNAGVELRQTIFDPVAAR